MSKEKLFEMARINKDHAEKGTMTLVDDVVKIDIFDNFFDKLFVPPNIFLRVPDELGEVF